MHYAKKIWNALRGIWDFLVLARVPIVIVSFGTIMTLSVDQIRDLFEACLADNVRTLFSFAFAAGLGVVIWLSTRTLYSFNNLTPIRPNGQQLDSALEMNLRVWLPRLLGASVPAILGIGFLLSSTRSIRYGWLMFGFAASLVLLLAISAQRRFVISVAARWPKLGTKLTLPVETGDSLVSSWRELGSGRRWHAAGVLAFLGSIIVGRYWSNILIHFGPIALILGAGSFVVWASTWPIYMAQKWRFPLCSALFVWASLLVVLRSNDNHGVRLSAAHLSSQDPPSDLHYGGVFAATDDLNTYSQRWWHDRADGADCNGRVFFVSSEGGGIRAAIWTAKVLSQLDLQTTGKFSRCVLAMSGVSGGSLGLASVVAAMQAEPANVQRRSQLLNDFLSKDFLTPILGSLFGNDLAQRFFPGRLTIDRGETLERAWESAWRASTLAVLGQSQNQFELPYAHLYQASLTLPLLFLNSTVVASGGRFIQQPFVCAKDFDLQFPGAKNSLDWLPNETPLSSVVHNSARFTFVSPAGTVRTRDKGGDVRLLGQLVDGGYFENSGVTTLLDMLNASAVGLGNAKIVVVHISNDEFVRPFVAQALDVCPRPPATDAIKKIPEEFGEVRAPILALMHTREARGEYARKVLAQRQTRAESLFHFRICTGEHAIPLGWYANQETMAELDMQLKRPGVRTQMQQIADSLNKALAITK
jgi:hypothetical protein